MHIALKEYTGNNVEMNGYGDKAVRLIHRNEIIHSTKYLYELATVHIDPDNLEKVSCKHLVTGFF